MADIKLNFSSQWPTIQVAKVFNNPQVVGGEVADFPHSRKFKHNLGYPPFAIGMSKNAGVNSFELMVGLDVDDTYVYTPLVYQGIGELDCAVVYAIDITKDFSYDNYISEVGEVIEDKTSKGIDMRDFLLHSRAVGPMVLTQVTKNFTASDTNLTYTSPLNYPTFSFGWIRHSDPSSPRKGIWQNAPLTGQVWPVMFTDGYTSSLATTGSPPLADKGSIIVLRNPAIITNNTVNVTI